MNWKNRLRNYNFWISIFSAVLLILQALKLEFDIAYINEIFTAVLGLLVVIGIISDPTRTTVKANDATTQSVNQKVENVKPEQVEIQENTLPNVEADEVNSVDIENDFQTIMSKISTDLEEKMKFLDEKLKKLEHFNIQPAVTASLTNQEDTEKVENNNETMASAPAVAELENPFVD